MKDGGYRPHAFHGEWNYTYVTLAQTISVRYD